MSNKTLDLTDAAGQLQPNLYDYLLSVSLRETEILSQLRQETAQHPEGDMQISPEQGQFMALLVQLIGAKKTLEIGTFTGYSTLWLALALPEDGIVVTCDISEEDTAIARRYWQAAGVTHKIDWHIAPAVETLNQLLLDGQAETFDFVFIDADKVEYKDYYEKSLQLIRPGGLIAIDNVLWCGRVIDPDFDDDACTIAIRELNQFLHRDQRVALSLVAIADGLTLALKRPLNQA
ncbi:class I SAM-dependent methyltransferase [Gloeocapsopsis sp. IPPAS B-1203]|uniref:class I SAM-dependent methyltransferase n=1 Tax=Gloeocapsopsis sp. IPPAS B-1203 TaxID=2049454 RepID=UPI000C1A2345|nr:class I SAM-dependent methyltransferase [Gloeocapsopsis sp. IPPAS B-1203]PIG94541.1 SAM-dependent methyltransferase [Gloeocapsopsis sp. IPPAS B-1203]